MFDSMFGLVGGRGWNLGEGKRIIGVSDVTNRAHC